MNTDFRFKKNAARVLPPKCFEIIGWMVLLELKFNTVTRNETLRSICSALFRGVLCLTVLSLHWPHSPRSVVKIYKQRIREEKGQSAGLLNYEMRCAN